jgi:hypothetical protein
MHSLHGVNVERVAAEINDEFDKESVVINDVDRSEDLLSNRLVNSIRKALGQTQRDLEEISSKSNLYISVQAYKVTGRLEQDHGDIAIVVTDLDHNITGTGFYEAKAEFHEGYPAYRMRQLRRLEAKTPRLAVAMYERNAKPVSDDAYSPSLSYHAAQESTSLRYCRVLPASWVRQFPKLEDAASQILPTSFGHHFVTRYLLGRDLDYSRTAANAIERWVRITRRATPVILEIVISRNPDWQHSSSSPGILPGSMAPEILVARHEPLALEPDVNPTLIPASNIKIQKTGA